MPASSIVVGVALLLVTLALRAASVNRLVRSRLLTSALLFGAYAVAAGLTTYGPLPADVAGEIHSFNPLLLTFGLATLVVVVTINPWREDRLPDRFPTIVQDAIVIALFAIVATLIMQEKVLATTAVGAVVVGFALQDTLGNLFSGLAIQIEKPFRVGHWVTIGGSDGLVSEVTWRATKIRTKAGNFMVVPNSVVAKETITNYSEPTHDTRIEVEVGAAYDTPPNQVKEVIARALRAEPMFVATREPEILIADFADSAITYRVRVWITDFAADMRPGIACARIFTMRSAATASTSPIRSRSRSSSTRSPTTSGRGQGCSTASRFLRRCRTSSANSSRWRRDCCCSPPATPSCARMRRARPCSCSSAARRR